jgi:hypothetical protein
VILETLEIDSDELRRRTGWELRPEGACKGALCVPLPERADARVLSERLGMPLVEEPAHGVWALGPETVTGRALTSAQAPELELPGFDGRPFALSSRRGRKVVLVAWASW